jgi:hypothetical protein
VSVGFSFASVNKYVVHAIKIAYCIRIVEITDEHKLAVVTHCCSDPRRKKKHCCLDKKSEGSHRSADRMGYKDRTTIQQTSLGNHCVWAYFGPNEATAPLMDGSSYLYISRFTPSLSKKKKKMSKTNPN